MITINAVVCMLLTWKGIMDLFSKSGYKIENTVGSRMWCLQVLDECGQVTYPQWASVPHL